MKIIFTLDYIKKTTSFKIYIFLFTTTFQFSFPFRDRRRLLLFNGVLSAQESPKELMLLCMNYDVVLRLENVESQH